MAIGDDFTIDVVDKKITHTSGTTVYTVNELYSWLMDTFDELDYMDDPVPMSAQTPTEYTFINEWFIDDESVKYLKTGAIKTVGYNGKIQVLKLLESGYTNCVATDIGKQVKDDTVEIGPLLAYDNTLRKWWIRSTSTVADASAMTITDGTGAGTADGASVTGEDLYANIYTLGTITDDPSAQIYVFQAGEAIPEWSNLTNWDRGHIDVLIKVKEAGTEIDEGKVTVFARQYGDLYDNYEIDLTAGGRNAVPLATSTDIDNPTGEVYLLYDAQTAGFTLKEILTGGTSGATAEIIADDNWGTEGCLTLGDVKGTFVDNETITDSATGSATVNGTTGDTFLKYDAQTVAFAVDYILTGGTSGAKRKIVGIQADNSTGKLVLKADVDYWTNPDYYKAFKDNETITDNQTTPGSATADGASITIVSGYWDIYIAFVNGTLNYDAMTAAFTVGEKLTGGTSGATAIILKDVLTDTDTGTLTLGNVDGTFQDNETITDSKTGSATVNGTLTVTSTMNKAFEAAAEKPYNIIVDCRGRHVADVYEYFKHVCGEDSVHKMFVVIDTTITKLDGEEYIAAKAAYAPKKASPLATFAGGVLFGARGLWIENMHSDDVRSYTLIDADGNKQDPPNKQPLRVTAVVSGDRVSIFRTTAGEIDKAMYTSHATNNTSGKTTFEVQEDLPVDTPASGVIRLVDTGTHVEKRHTYTSWSGKIFSGLSPSLTQDYDGADKCYVPFIDGEATTDYIEKIVIYTADRPILTRVRKKGIIPFEIAGTFVSTGYTVAAIRTTDGIVT